MVSYKDIYETLPHEIGHTIDISKREYKERSNNVLKKFSNIKIYKKKFPIDTYDFDSVRNSLTLDNIDPLLRGCTKENKNTCKGFFEEHGDYKESYLLWWNIESLFPGYWGKLNNLYRYNEDLYKGLQMDEALVLLTNIVLGFDTGYYFERFGLSGKTIFNNSNTSKLYKEKMNELIKERKVVTTIIKNFWYLDNDEYEYIINKGYGCYSESGIFNDYSVEKIISKIFVIKFPTINCTGHYGFEVYESDNLIGFTLGKSFSDQKKYPDNYIPNYKVIAYDRLLKHTRFPEESFPHNKIIGL